MKRIEEAAFQRGADPEQLMECAGAAIARSIRDFFPSPCHAIAVCGKGNNAGDVLVAARHLAREGWSIEMDLSFPESDLSALAAKKLSELKRIPEFTSATTKQNPGSKIILDGLLGIGARGNPREPVASAIERINMLRRSHGFFVVAADIPSGLNADTGEVGEPCVTADLTVTIGHAKIGLLADHATNDVGRLALAPLAELTAGGGDPAELITPGLLRPLLTPPVFDSHKGIWGRVGIIAGSRGFLGAGRLCSEAAVRAGAGLVTLYAKPDAYDLLAATAIPEVMVKPVRDYTQALEDHLDAIGIGPGLGSEHDGEILKIVRETQTPSVVDADALNTLSRHAGEWQSLAGPRLFTPHPGEMARLFPEGKDMARRAAAEQFAALHDVTLLLKGARTVIAQAGMPTVFNTTGNPGMGSGGMGDVLTGVCAALMARHHSPRDAAMLGAWICGRAAECYVFGPHGSPESLIASEVIHHLGAAMRELNA